MKRIIKEVWVKILIYVVGMIVIENGIQNGWPSYWRLIAVLVLLGIYCACIKVEKPSFATLHSFSLRKTLYLCPFVIIGSVNLWRGIVWNISPLESLIYFLSMIGVGFIEEILFRGFLFEDLKTSSLKAAILVSSLTFGVGHIVNLLKGADFLPTLLQICYAAAVGLMLSVFVWKTRNILPCCIFHGLFNGLSVFSNEAGMTNTYQIVVCLIMIVISVGYALYLRRYA